jgi:hypothetical protein
MLLVLLIVGNLKLRESGNPLWSVPKFIKIRPEVVELNQAELQTDRQTWPVCVHSYDAHCVKFTKLGLYNKSDARTFSPSHSCDGVKTMCQNLEQ